MEIEHRSIIIPNIDHDPTLLSTRHMLLQSAGYAVESTSSLERAIKSLRDGDFDLVIMCHSLSEAERAYLVNLIRDDGLSLPVVLMATGYAPDPDWLTSGRSASAPVELLQNVELALQQERVSRTGSLGTS